MKILNFVKNGGGLFVAITPWGWAQLKGSNEFSIMLSYNTLIEAGLFFNENYIYGSSLFYTNKTDLYLSHLGALMPLALNPENSAVNYKNVLSVARQIQNLPSVIKSKF